MQTRDIRGFTLLETLVTLVIITLLTTLVFQVIGFFSIAQKKLISAGQGTIEQRRAAFWFRESIHGGVAPRTSDELAGDRHGFELTTISSLNHPAGYPVRIKWRVDYDSAGDDLIYADDTGQAWRVLSGLQKDSGRFEYVDKSGDFHDAWPPEKEDRTGPGRELKLIRFHADDVDTIDWYVAYQTRKLYWQFDYE